MQTYLATPKATWPLMGRTGMRMRKDEAATTSHVTFFVFEHSTPYQVFVFWRGHHPSPTVVNLQPLLQDVQMRFFRAVNSLDPNQISALLQAHPYHIDGLLQLSEAR